MSLSKRISQRWPHINVKLPLPFQANASRGPKRIQANHEGKLYSPRNLRISESEVAQGKERHRLKRVQERNQLEEGSASNAEFLQALDEKEYVLEVQTVILEKLAAEENSMKGLSDNCKAGLEA